MSEAKAPPTEDELSAIREGVRAVVGKFGDDYWLARDDDGLFPREFHRAMADAGWLGITMPEEYGGSNLGVTEAAVMMHEVASHGGGMAAASTVHINLFGPHPIVVTGTPEQKARWLPRLIAGKDQCAFGFTEPDAGLNTTRIITGAGRGIALDLARAGAAVVVNDLGVGLAGEPGGETPVAEQVAEEIRALGGRAAASRDSVASWEGAHRIVETAPDAFGRRDGVVNNAGNLRDSLFHKMTEEEFDSVLAVRLKGSFNVSRAAAPHFKGQASGA